MLTPSDIGSMNYHVLRSIISEERILEKQIGAEIGVLYGQTSHYLLYEFPQLTLLSIDPWLSYEEVEGERSQDEMNKYEDITRQRLAPFGERSVIIKSTSAEVASNMADGVLDFVFIDALHTYEGVKQDMAAWYSKVRPGGLFAGHDFSWKGVQQAVNEFAEEHSLSGFFTPAQSDLWYFIKPGGKQKTTLEFSI